MNFSFILTIIIKICKKFPKSLSFHPFYSSRFIKFVPSSVGQSWHATWLQDAREIKCSHFFPKVIKMTKIPQHQEYHGIFYCHIVKIFRDIWQINLIGLLRYGNPDVLNLATLKIEIKIHYFLNILK